MQKVKASEALGPCLLIFLPQQHVRVAPVRLRKVMLVWALSSARRWRAFPTQLLFL